MRCSVRDHEWRLEWDWMPERLIPIQAFPLIEMECERCGKHISAHCDRFLRLSGRLRFVDDAVTRHILTVCGMFRIGRTPHRPTVRANE